jgi:hypothetical protein
LKYGDEIRGWYAQFGQSLQFIKHLLLDVNAVGYVYGPFVDIIRRVKILK